MLLAGEAATGMISTAGKSVIIVMMVVFFVLVLFVFMFFVFFRWPGSMVMMVVISGIVIYCAMTIGITVVMFHTTAARDTSRESDTKSNSHGNDP